jgi:hypothetical protein
MKRPHLHRLQAEQIDPIGFLSTHRFGSGYKWRCAAAFDPAGPLKKARPLVTKKLTSAQIISKKYMCLGINQNLPLI